jgi:hypothetical protein
LLPCWRLLLPCRSLAFGLGAEALVCFAMIVTGLRPL